MSACKGNKGRERRGREKGILGLGVFVLFLFSKSFNKTRDIVFSILSCVTICLFLSMTHDFLFSFLVFKACKILSFLACATFF